MPIPNRFGNNDSQGMPQNVTEGSMGGLAGWCMARVRLARDERDERYETRWKEYTRSWRGFWDEKDKTTDSERSRIVSPATQQAIEMTVAEMQEAVFGREAWFDIEDNLEDQEKGDATIARDLLLEELEASNVPAEINKVFLLGAVYGTGIAKINVTMKDEAALIEGERVVTPKVVVSIEAVRPDQFVIDTAALNVDEAEFVAHEMLRPQHLIKARQAGGVYSDDQPVGVWAGEHRASTDGTERYSSSDHIDNGVLITEYFGLVPGSMLPGYEGNDLMVESIVTIANEGHVLRAVESPFVMKDRPIIAYQHDVVPGEFWGRGVAEKGFNPQKALDAELRARADALALLNAPMMGADITRLSRNPDMRIRPGKTIFARGNPREVFSPIAIGDGQILQSTFQQTSDLERMITMATGAMDSAAPLNTNRRNETASGMSMMGAGFIKRSKRAMANVEHAFLRPLVQKALWRYTQFQPTKFPQDYKFVPKATMGIMAKEIENTQLTNMLGYLEPKSPEYQIVVKAIFDNTSSSNKAELAAAMEAMLAPPTDEEKQLQKEQQENQKQSVQLELQKMAKEIEKLASEIEKNKADAYKTLIVAELEDDKVEIQAANAVTGAERVRLGDRQTHSHERVAQMTANAKSDS